MNPERKRLFLLRHGESLANLDQAVYRTIPDYRIPLTETGHRQAAAAGVQLKHELAGRSVRAYVSPYLRAHQTFRELGLADQCDRLVEEPRLREQDWANYQDPDDVAEQRRLRDGYGHFFYRFREGESGADVYDRVSGFIESLTADLSSPSTPDDVLLVTHGLTMRLFCMRWFGWTVEYFESLDNPGNAELKIISGEPVGWRLDRPFAQWKPAAVDTTIADR